MPYTPTDAAATVTSHRHYYAVKKLAAGLRELRRSIPATQPQFQRDIDEFAKSFRALIHLHHPDLAPLVDAGL